MSTPDMPEAELRLWTATVVPAGHELRGWRPLLSGNSRGIWSAEIVGGGAPSPVVLRVDSGAGPFSGTELDLQREVVVYRALSGRAVRLPRLIGSGPGRMLIERLPGDARWTSRSLPSLLEELTRLHAVPAADLDLPGWDRRASADVELWNRISAKLPGDPLLTVAVRILRENFPGEPPRIVLCHGDAGPGNALFEDGALTGLLDWEFAHLGDPMDDLAWVAVRAALYEIELPGFAEAVRAHYAAPGGSPDVSRFRYWRAVVIWRNLVTCLAAVAQPGGDKLLHLILVPALRAMLIDSLADLAGVELPVRATVPAELLDAPSPTEPGTAEIAAVAQRLRALEAGMAGGRKRQEVALMRVHVSQLAATWGRVPPAGDPAAGGHVLHGLATAASRALAALPRAARLAARPLADLTAP